MRGIRYKSLYLFLVSAFFVCGCAPVQKITEQDRSHGEIAVLKVSSQEKDAQITKLEELVAEQLIQLRELSDKLNACSKKLANSGRP